MRPRGPAAAALVVGGVAVLLRVYAKCIVGQDESARRRIEDAMGEEEEGVSRSEAA